MKALLFVTLFFLVSCSVDGPFDRGEKTSPAAPPVSEKPPLTTVPAPEEDFAPVPVPDLTGEQVYNLEVEPLINADCLMCHRNKIKNYDDAKARIVPGEPGMSLLYTRATGERHRRIWDVDSPAAETVARWILLEN